MVSEPVEPKVRHVWVCGGHLDKVPTWPGLVLQWVPAPLHNATASAWSALVLVNSFPGAVLVQWVSADRVFPVRDAAAADGT